MEFTRDEYVYYTNWVLHVILGRLGEADGLMAQHGGSIRRMARKLRINLGVPIRTIWRGLLLEPEEVPPDRMVPPWDQTIGSVSWSEDKEVGCWFADRDSNMSTVIRMQRPTVTGWIMKTTPKKRNVLWHWSWQDRFPSPRGPGTISLTALASMHPSIDITQFHWALQTQKEVILSPFNRPVEVVSYDEAGCPSTEDLNRRLGGPLRRNPDQYDERLRKLERQYSITNSNEDLMALRTAQHRARIPLFWVEIILETYPSFEGSADYHEDEVEGLVRNLSLNALLDLADYYSIDASSFDGDYSWQSIQHRVPVEYMDRNFDPEPDDPSFYYRFEVGYEGEGSSIPPQRHLEQLLEPDIDSIISERENRDHRSNPDIEVGPEIVAPRLYAVAKSYPTKIHAGPLKVGDVVEKSSGYSYLIDDLDIWREVIPMRGEEDKLTVTRAYKTIFSHGFCHRGVCTTTLMRELPKLVEIHGSIIPFSEVIKLGVSECSENSILLHLALQDRFELFLIEGVLYDQEGFPSGYHHFNVIIRPDVGPYLIDVVNPIKWTAEGSAVKPYIVPILGMYQNMKFLSLPDWAAHNGQYSII